MMDERMTESERTTLCRRIDELCAENERLRQENQSIGMAAYDFGYRNGSVHYELEHCPACKNIADLQEALEENAKLRKENDTLTRRIDELCMENDKLRELMRDMVDYGEGADSGMAEWFADRLHELGVDDA